MQINREQFIKAIKFLKPAIIDSDLPIAENHVHVVVDGPRCVLTSYNCQIAKRATLFKPMLPQDIEGGEEAHEQAEFLIPKTTLLSFEIMCQKHRQKLEKSKSDLSLSVIDIFQTSLESHKDSVRYEQPIGVRFPDLSDLFEEPRGDYEFSCYMKWDYESMIDCMKEFGGVVDVVFTVSDGPVYFKNEHLNFEAVLITNRGSDG